MKGSILAAQLIYAALLFAALNESNAKNTKKNLNIFSHPNDLKGPPGPGRPFIPPLPLPRNPSFAFPPVTQAPSISDPYACLPRYLCIIENKKGEKRTTIVHGLHPALRKSKPDVIDPSTLPQVKVPGVPKTVVRPRPTISEASDDEKYRDREFSDSFLKQQEMAEAMAFLEEKRRQFMYQQGLPKQKIITKGGQKKKPVKDVEKLSKESNEDEEKSKEEVSKEEEADKSVEISKEDKEEEKSLELSKEDKDEEKSLELSKEDKEEESEKSLELSKEEKEEEDSIEDDASSENAKSRSKLTKYKLSKKRKSTFKSRMDDYEDVDSLDDHLATVPWDDRLRNDTDPLKPSEIYDKLFRNVLPSFQLPSLPKIQKKIAKSIPGMSFLASGSDEEEVTTTTTTTTARPWLFKRMLNRVTGKGSSNSNPVPSIRRRYGRPVRRYKRGVSEKLRLISEDSAIVKQIRDPERQCRMIFKGCDLPYDHIMKMVSRGQVLIENDDIVSSTTKAPVANPTFSQDDEADQAVKDKTSRNKSQKPIQQLMAQASLGGKKKYGGFGGMKEFEKNKKKPMYDGSSEEVSVEQPPRPSPKKSVASLPLMPMKYQWGKPTYKVHGKPNGVSDFSGGITERVAYKAPPTTTTTSTTPRPIFAAIKLDIRDNLTNPSLQHSVIKVNQTHAVHVLSKKPYNPPKTRTRDAKGQPVSFNSVFTEIAGQTGGIHDFFDRISGAFGGDGTEAGREFISTFPGSTQDVHGNLERFPVKPKKNKPAFPPFPTPPPQPPKKVDGESDERDEEDSASEEDQEENKETEKENENEEDQDEDEEGDNEDLADDLGDGSSTPGRHQRPSKRPISEQAEHLAFQSENKKLEKNKKPQKEEEQQQDNQQESEEEEEENDEGEPDLPDNIPPLVRQSIIQEYKRKQQEEAQGGNGGGGRPGGAGGQQYGSRPGGPGPGPQGRRPAGGRPHGRPGQRPPPRGGGFLSSLFS